MTTDSDLLEAAREELDLSLHDLWLRYFTLGGMSDALEIEAILYGAVVAVDHDRDLLAVAINERFAEDGRARALPYIGDAGRPA